MAIQTAFLIGGTAGLLLAFVIGLFTDRISGVLRIDHSNPDKDIYRFEFDKYVDLSKKKRVVVKVDNNANLSQK